ncbi:hypothetical protein ABPG72_015358 [Tetrahymena utriculariae]
MTSPSSNKQDIPLISSDQLGKKESQINHMEQRLSDKFEEFSQKRSQSNRIIARGDRPTEILEVNEVSPLLHLLEERIRKFEETYGKRTGFYFGLICSAVLSFCCIASEVYMPQLPTIEVMFVAFLVAFLFNYYLIRDGEILPYIETESENFVAKISGISGFASIILFIFSFQKCELQTSLFWFGTSWIFYMAFESCSKNSQTKLNRNQIMFGLLMIVVTGLILRPNFTPEVKMTQTPANPDDDATSTIEVDYSHVYGVISALVSGIFFGYMNMCIRQLKNQNFITITHIFTYIQAPFIPVFFPLQKLVSPSLAQWVFMIGLGLIFVFVLQLYIRSCQLENTTKSLLTIPQFIAFITIFSLLLGINTYGEPDIIKLLCALVILGLSFKFSTEIDSKLQEVATLTQITTKGQDIPLDTFKDNTSLNQKLLEEQN